MGYQLSWVAQTPNVKTGNIPTAYVGQTLDECRDSCQGCALLEKECYAWHGLSRVSLGRIEERIREGVDYSLANALENRHRDAKAARIGAMGDPARADRRALLRDVKKLRAEGLAILSYTHFWRERQNQRLRSICMASCEFVEDAEEARSKGWLPAMLLPWDYHIERGPLVEIAGGERLLVCPAQTKGKNAVTCNDCRMCDPEHPVWERGKIAGIGFLDHSRAARKEQRAWQKGRQLPMFGDRSAKTLKR